MSYQYDLLNVSRSTQAKSFTNSHTGLFASSLTIDEFLVSK